MTAQHHQPSGPPTPPPVQTGVDGLPDVPARYEEALIDALRALEVLDNLGETLCVAAPIDYAPAHGLPQEIIDRLEKVTAAVGVLVDDGEDAIWDFAKAANMADELIEREQWRR
jgi:hypothetical protein